MPYTSRNAPILVALMTRLGRTTVVILITASVSLASTLLLWLLWPLVFPDPFEPRALILAFVIAALLCSSVTWYLTKIAFRLHELENEMRQLATYDSLTNVYNRRAYIAASESVFELMIRTEKSLTIAYLDVDAFKTINDEFGHTAGDKVLTRLTQRLKAHTRKSDVIGRLGGDEFALTLPDTNAAGARELLERIRRDVADSHTRDPAVDATAFSVSVGFASFETQRNDTLQSLIRRADGALYLAKRSGKNCVTSFDDRAHTPVGTD